MKFEPLQYSAYLIPSAILFMLLWSFFINGNLYYCSDPVPIIDFIPPFVHDSFTGDYYKVAEQIVWLVWILFLVLIFTLPIFILKILNKQQ